MKKLLLLSLTLILISGCGASAQEKRNNYDACLIEEKSKFWKEKWAADPQMYESDRRNWERKIENRLPNLCVHNLK